MGDEAEDGGGLNAEGYENLDNQDGQSSNNLNSESEE